MLSSIFDSCRVIPIFFRHCNNEVKVHKFYMYVEMRQVQKSSSTECREIDNEADGLSDSS